MVRLYLLRAHKISHLMANPIRGGRPANANIFTAVVRLISFGCAGADISCQCFC